MSLLCRCAGDTIAKFITLAMKLRGEERLVSIRPSLLALSGCKRIRCQRLRIKQLASKTQSPQSRIAI
jgi:hypothetical protein